MALQAPVSEWNMVLKPLKCYLMVLVLEQWEAGSGLAGGGALDSVPRASWKDRRKDRKAQAPVPSLLLCAEL